MENNTVSPFKLDVINCFSQRDIKEKLYVSLEKYGTLFPQSKNALILLKPNLNSNMNSLTGNTTDLRLLSALIQFLKDKGYTNIVIGEGTNSGFYRNKIGVISRLQTDRLAEFYGVKVKDLNYDEPFEIDFDGGEKVHLSRKAVDADLLINLPKLKTHFENGMSVCLKNLMGCLIGQENKKKAHNNLPENILRINLKLKPHLHIVDGLIAMEGLGPTRGTPIRMDTVLMGTDPYLIDLACARLAMFDYKKVRTLALAEKKGLLTPQHHSFIDSLKLEQYQKNFSPPKAGFLAGFIHNPKRQKSFLKIRNTAFFSYLASTNWFGKILFAAGLRQDVFLKEELSFDGLYLKEEICDSCGICRDVCPMGLNLPEYLKKIDSRCIECLYCFSVCPLNAITLVGQLGFFKEQLKQYDHLIRSLYK